MGRLAVLVVVALGLAALLAAGGAWLIGEMRLNQKVAVPNETFEVRTDIASIQHGQHLAGAIALCSQCHAMNMAGKVVVDQEWGRIVAPNLTRGGLGASLSDTDYVRAIRYGVAHSGHQLLIMPADDYNHMSDTDLASIVAYLRSVPPIQNTLPPSDVRALGRLLFATGQLDLVPAAHIDRTASRSPSELPTPSLTPAYGGYLSELAGCARCHKLGVPGGSLSENDFVQLMRTGRRPDGRILDTSMPWPYYAQMSDLELRAIWAFFGSVPIR